MVCCHRGFSPAAGPESLGATAGTKIPGENGSPMVPLMAAARSFVRLGALLVFALLCPFLAAAPAAASSCVAAAGAWIEALDGVDREMLRRHTEANCRFSGKWVEENAAEEDLARRQRLCNDLVLLWTYKKCVYFRDYVDPATYDPCMAWVRRMFSRCMANEVSWFAPPGADARR
jgi:hypothetical protein